MHYARAMAVCRSFALGLLADASLLPRRSAAAARRVATSSAVHCTAFGLLAPLWWHGGWFPPVKPVPPPSDTTPRTPSPSSPPARPGPSTPRGVGPSTPGPATPTTPNTPTSPSFPGGMPTTDPWASDMSSWRVWWRFNQDEFLELQSHLDRMDLATGSEEFFRGSSMDSVDRRSSGPTDVDERIVPALLAALRRDASIDTLTSSMIALARIGERPAADGTTPHAAAIAPLLFHPQQEVAETAALALGILGANSPRNVDLLTRFVADDREGLRKLHAVSFASPISERSRAFATYGLGLLGERSRDVFVRRWIVRSLHAELAQARADGSRELGAAAITALGLVPLERATERRRSDDSKAPRAVDEQFALLLEVYLDERIEDVVRAHVPLALARLIERGPPEPAWRERAEDTLWTLFNTADYLFIP